MTKQRKVFLINMEYPPIAGPGVWRMLGFSRYLDRLGYAVHVVCADRSSWHDRRDESLLDYAPATVNVTRLKGVYLRDIDAAIQRRIDRRSTGIRRSFFRGLEWRLKRWWPDISVLWAFKAAWHTFRMAHKERPDVILTSGPPHLSHIAGIICKKRFKLCWIMDYRDPWTADGYRDQVINGPYQDALFSRLENYLLKRADAIVSVSPSWLLMLQSKVRDENIRVELIRNGHDLDYSFVEQMYSGIARRNDERCRIHFNGTIQKGSNLLNELALALRYLRDELEVDISRFIFSFCGLPDSFLTSEGMSDLRSNFLDVGYLELVHSIEQSLQADALLVLVREGNPVAKGIIPAKVYEQMALGKSIVAVLPQESDTRDLLNEYPLAKVSDDTNPTSIAFLLQKVLYDFELMGNRLPSMACAERKAFFDLHARPFHSRQLAELFESILEKDHETTP